jgi:hypothetical protein
VWSDRHSRSSTKCLSILCSARPQMHDPAQTSIGGRKDKKQAPFQTSSRRERRSTSAVDRQKSLSLLVSVSRNAWALSDPFCSGKAFSRSSLW